MIEQGQAPYPARSSEQAFALMLDYAANLITEQGQEKFRC